MDDNLRRLVARWHRLPVYTRVYVYLYVRLCTMQPRVRASIAGLIMALVIGYVCAPVGEFTALVAAAGGAVSGLVAHQRLRNGYTLMQSLCVSGVALVPAAVLYRAAHPVTGWVWAWVLSSAVAVMTALVIMIVRDLFYRRRKVVAR